MSQCPLVSPVSTKKCITCSVAGRGIHSSRLHLLPDECKDSHAQAASSPAIQREVHVQWKTSRPAPHGLSNRKKRTHLPTPCLFVTRVGKLLLEAMPGCAKQLNESLCGARCTAILDCHEGPNPQSVGCHCAQLWLGSAEPERVAEHCKGQSSEPPENRLIVTASNDW
jgi:hypothetical protein